MHVCGRHTWGGTFPLIISCRGAWLSQSGQLKLSLALLPPVYRATSNNKVREMVVLELSYVNSNLQLLMGQLEGLNSSVEVYQSTQ